jgi:hypothetical protein
MANEVIITYWNAATVAQGASSGVFGDHIGGEVTDIGTRSGAFDGEIARITAKGTAFWGRFGGSAVNAVANTDANFYLAAGESIDIEVSAVNRYVDTAADA